MSTFILASRANAKSRSCTSTLCMTTLYSSGRNAGLGGGGNGTTSTNPGGAPGTVGVGNKWLAASGRGLPAQATSIKTHPPAPTHASQPGGLARWVWWVGGIDKARSFALGPFPVSAHWGSGAPSTAQALAGTYRPNACLENGQFTLIGVFCCPFIGRPTGSENHDP